MLAISVNILNKNSCATACCGLIYHTGTTPMRYVSFVIFAVSSEYLVLVLVLLTGSPVPFLYALKAHIVPVKTYVVPVFLLSCGYPTLCLQVSCFMIYCWCPHLSILLSMCCCWFRFLSLYSLVHITLPLGAAGSHTLFSQLLQKIHCLAASCNGVPVLPASCGFASEPVQDHVLPSQKRCFVWSLVWWCTCTWIVLLHIILCSWLFVHSN